MRGIGYLHERFHRASSASSDVAMTVNHGKSVVMFQVAPETRRSCRGYIKIGFLRLV